MAPGLLENDSLPFLGLNHHIIKTGEKSSLVLNIPIIPRRVHGAARFANPACVACAGRRIGNGRDLPRELDF